MVELAVTLSKASDEVVTVSYRTVDGTANAASDYTAASGTLTFEAGVRRQVIGVATTQDELAESDEKFTVELSGPNGATLGDATGTATIIDDDTETPPVETVLPVVSIEDATVDEGGTAELAVTLSKASEQAVTVSYATVDGTAAAGLDYTAASATLTFEAGARRQVIRVATTEDELVESDEEFTVELSGPNGATLGDAIGRVRITDDDSEAQPVLPRLNIANATVREGGTATFVVRLSAASATPVTVAYQTVDGTAAAGSDYTAVAGTLRFAAGATTQGLSVETLADELVEGDERFRVELSTAVGATIADGVGEGTIVDERPSLDPVSRVVLPELGRALAFNAVRCRIDEAFSNLAKDATRPFVRLPVRPAAAAPEWGAPGPMPLSVERTLGGASFLVSSKGGISMWGCTDYRSLAGVRDRAVTWDGDVFSGQFGAEVKLHANGFPGWAGTPSSASFGPKGVAGFSISRSRASFDYEAGDGDEGGEYDLALIGLHPYIGWSIAPGVHVWGTVGLSWGKLGVTDDIIGTLREGDARLNSGALGLSARVLARDALFLKLKGEAALAQLDGERVTSLFGSGIDLGRLRLSLEGSREYAVRAGGTLTPWGELGVRHDGGDGENGVGVELGGGLRYAHPVTGWSAEAQGRWLATHGGALEREAGFGALVRFAPGSGGLGPSFSVASSLGDGASGVQALWERDAMGRLPSAMTAASFEARIAYGFAALRGGGVLTPYGALSMHRERGRGYRLGVRMAPRPSAVLSLEAEVRERPTATEHGVTARVRVGF